MNKEEIDKWLDEEYGCSYTRLEELHDFYFEKYTDLKQENQTNKTIIEKQVKRIYVLECILEELKKWLKEEEREYRKGSYSSEYGMIIGTMIRVLDKIKELEEGVK